MKYRKKPIIVEAVQWNGDRDIINKFMGLSENPYDTNHAYYRDDTKNQVIIKTLEGNMAAEIGDYIIKGVKGEFYTCKPDIFQMTYEKATR